MLMDSVRASLFRGFVNRHLEQRYRGVLDASFSRWANSILIIVCLALAVGLARCREATFASPEHAMILIAARLIECLLVLYKHRVGRHAFIAAEIVLHRAFQVLYIFNLVPWSPLADEYLMISGSTYLFMYMGLSVIVFYFSIPLEFHHQILYRIAIEAVRLLFNYQVKQQLGIDLQIMKQVVVGFTLSLAVGFLNDFLRRVYFLKTLLIEQQQIEQQQRAMGRVRTDRDDKALSRAPLYTPTLVQQRITIRITTPSGSDEGIFAAMESDVTQRRVNERLIENGSRLLHFSVRKGSVIVEIEAYVPQPSSDEDDLDFDFGAWLQVLQVQDMTSLVDGSVVTVSVGNRSRAFSYCKSNETWTPLDTDTTLSPLVPVMASLLSRMIPCCTTLSPSPRSREVAFSAMWLYDEPLAIGSLREVGIQIDAVGLGCMPIPFRLQPAFPRDWKKGSLVNLIIQLPESCQPGVVRVNMWSTFKSLACPSNMAHIPSVVAASLSILILPSDCSAMADELNHLRSSRPPAHSGIDSLLLDIGQLVSFQAKGNVAHSDLIAALKAIQEGLIRWCPSANLRHTLDFIRKIDLSTLSDATAPSSTLAPPSLDEVNPEVHAAMDKKNI